MHFASEAVSI